jgi:predicted esterase YcpF (UPF0227 family)
MRQKIPLVFYFHGYGSSAKADKALKLKEAFPETYAWDINIDPDISLPYLKEKIDCVLMDHYNDCMTVPIFVGSSLGGWYASQLAHIYGCSSILINPSWNSIKTLERYDVPLDIRSKYTPFLWSSKAKYFIAKDDEVIDFEPVRSVLNSMDTEWVDNSNHYFNGPEFDKVIEHIRKLVK